MTMRDGNSPRDCILLLALSCAVLGGAGAHAQTAGVDALEEVVVTAKRRSQDIQTASLSATVLSQDLLEDKGVVDLFALQYAAPAITVTQYGSANVFNIRGLGRSQVDIDVPSGVVIYRDGTPTLAGYFQNEPYFDMESVEVYRGPQGTFVGKNAAGGAVFISTNDPQLRDFSASVELGAGNYESLEGTGIVNVPVGETVALRLAYRHSERGHFYDAITGNFTGHPGEVDNNSYRLGVLWQPVESFTGVFKLDYHDLDFGGNVTTAPGVEPLGRVEQNADFAYADESTRAVLDLKLRFGDGLTFSSLSGYQDVDSVNNLDLNGTLPLFYQFNSRIEATFYSQEFNIVSPEDRPFQWTLGVFWQEQDSELPPWQEGGFAFVGNGFPVAFPWATTPWDNEEQDRAVFAHASYRLTEKLELEGGVRYGEYQRDQFTQWILDDGATLPDTPWPGTTPGGDRQSIDEDGVDWQLALNFDVNQDLYLYGLVSRGHVTGGINIFPPFVIYDAMEVTNYEAGWKQRWAEGQFNTQFTVYYETFKDYQANFAETIVGLNFPTNRNAETDSTVWGLELSGQARFGAFSLDFGMAYSDSELGAFSDVVDPFRTAPNNVVNLSGARVPFSPELTGNVGIAYDLKLGTLTLTPRLDYSHVDETQAALWDSPLVTLQARDLLNAQVSLAPDSDRWSAVLWGTNVTDKHYIAGIQNNATLFYAAPPAQYGLRLTFRW